MTVVKNGYVTRKYLCEKYKVNRDWWLVKYNGRSNGYVNLMHVCFPREFLGKRVRFKVEVIK